ncbi:hypothetical protein LTR10_015106 [Elasticomyces elasticus]|uniref:Amidohydrolase-related domain-containing protein n=1 Tax=Exophiala sideris TaxID=1016849 RepID=A0ABR0JQW5_9EURO|nr:hypothetical protein LTR10_015106 [Elasticomyces elasticus]KAK5034696.1 hypothetical protein LTR13_006352 [Exophiala sideris]KAK5039982.1 hypothetical protein LTS07_000477 [Exophiala sideris]KAK5068360.1 hypothetical protein LTR69_000478 [Exophiala sideris]KAK5187662.1 hypothetical protein LTR44_000478 [Eurotiomycetes sp. CCFEE 6388]
MAPGRLVDEEVAWPLPTVSADQYSYEGAPRNVAYIQSLHYPKELRPKSYEIQGTHPDSQILFVDVKILEATGKLPYLGDVFIRGQRIEAIGHVPQKGILLKDPKVRVFHGKGRTLMPGLGDAHAHFSWNGSNLDRLGDIALEEHVLLTARSARCYLDSGYTMCFGAAAAKDRLDIVIRDAINAGDIPGPRYLANAKEIARTDGELVAGITAFADGPEQFEKVVSHHIDLGADQVKLSMSGEEITETRSAQDCYYTDEETAACARTAHNRGTRLCAHARARDSVKMCVKHEVDVIYHASFIDEEGMDMLEVKRNRHVVAPGINWLIATLYEAEAFGYPQSKAEKVGYKKELETAIRGLREMHRRGIVVLPGGDYGFAWTPHGTYSRDLAHFKNLLGFTAHEAIIASTFGVASLFMRSHEMGQLKEGYFADCILVDGNPLEDVEVLQDHDKLNIILINGRVHKAARSEYLPPSMATHGNNAIVPEDFPEVKATMQREI